MPNKRANNKVKVSAWVDKDTKEAVQRICQKYGLTLTDEFLKTLEELLKREADGKNNNKHNKES